MLSCVPFLSSASSDLSSPSLLLSQLNIHGASTKRLIVDTVRLSGASSGIYLLSCPGALLANVQGKNFRGPFPRGQCVQFDKSAQSRLEHFSCVNDIGSNSSFTEDNISIFQSDNVSVIHGLIDGNNSPSGDGVMVESGGSTVTGQTISRGLIEDVDAVNQGNGCFGGWAVSNVVFKSVRVSKTHCGGVDGRKKPSSGALVFSGGSEGKPPVASTGLRIENATYQQLCKKNLVWPGQAFAEQTLGQGTFTPRSPLNLKFCWEASDALKTDDVTGHLAPARLLHPRLLNVS